MSDYRFFLVLNTVIFQVNSADIPAMEKALLALEHPTDALVEETIRSFQVGPRRKQTGLLYRSIDFFYFSFLAGVNKVLLQPKEIPSFSLEERLPVIRELFHAK